MRYIILLVMGLVLFFNYTPIHYGLDQYTVVHVAENQPRFLNSINIGDLVLDGDRLSTMIIDLEVKRVKTRLLRVNYLDMTPNYPLFKDNGRMTQASNLIVGDVLKSNRSLPLREGRIGYLDLGNRTLIIPKTLSGSILIGFQGVKAFAG